MSLSIMISVAISFFTALLITPKIMRYMKSIGVIGIDQQKKGVVPESGGTGIAAGVFIGLLVFIGIATFMTHYNFNVTFLLAALVTIETITVIGFLDDVFTHKSKIKDIHGDVTYRGGLKQWQKAVLVLPAAIPLMAVNPGQTIMLGIQFGVLYPLVIIPFAVMCVSNATNMLAGLNGLESGLAVIALTGMGAFAFMTGSPEAAVIALCGAAAFMAFLVYNWYPAKIFPGDSATYLSGSLIVTVAVIGNIEKFAIIVFIPWIIEAFLKASRMFKATSFGKLTKQGYVKPKNDRIESLTHVVMSAGNFKEYQVVAIMMLIEALIVLGAFGLWAAGII